MGNYNHMNYFEEKKDTKSDTTNSKDTSGAKKSDTKTNDAKNTKTGTKDTKSVKTTGKTDDKKAAAFPWLWVIIGLVVVLGLGAFLYMRNKKNAENKDGDKAKAEGGDVELYMIKEVQDELI